MKQPIDRNLLACQQAELRDAPEPSSDAADTDSKVAAQIRLLQILGDAVVQDLRAGNGRLQRR